jgi:hypothetical protein
MVGGGVVRGTLGVPGFFDDDDDLTRLRICNLRSSTLRAHARVSRTSFDGRAAPFSPQLAGPLRGGNCRCESPPAAAHGADTSSSPETRSTTAHPSDDTNRNASIVASSKGRARLGLQVRIFRSKRSLRVVEEGRVCDAAAAGEELLRLLLLVGGRDNKIGFAVGEELVEVEFVVCRREVERCFGVVTSHMIVFKIGRVGSSNKPAFKDIAICVIGLWQAESIAEVEARRNWRCRSRASAGGSCCRDAVSHAEGCASADRHCRSWHNIAAGCCVASGEAFAVGVVMAASARGAATVAALLCSSSASGMGLRAGESDAGLTVVVVLAAEGMDCRSCSSALVSPGAEP